MPEGADQSSPPSKHLPLIQGRALPRSPVVEPAVDAHGPPPRQYRGRRDLTNGSIPRTLFHLSRPTVFEGALNGRLFFYVPYFHWGRWLRIRVI